MQLDHHIAEPRDGVATPSILYVVARMRGVVLAANADSQMGVPHSSEECGGVGGDPHEIIASEKPAKT